MSSEIICGNCGVHFRTYAEYDKHRRRFHKKSACFFTIKADKRNKEMNVNE